VERNASEPPTLGGALQRRDCKGGPGVLSNCDKSHPVVSSRFSAQPAVPTGGKADVPSETAIGVIEKGLIVDHPFDRLAFMMCGRAVLKAMPSSAARDTVLAAASAACVPCCLAWSTACRYC
jgi:hypothetical protein